METQAIGLAERALLVAPMVTVVLAMVAVVALVGWTGRRMRAHLATERVRHGALIELSMPRETALAIAEGTFSSEDWAPVAGDGARNWAHREPGHPGVSVEAVEAAGGCDVHVWMSRWTLRGRHVAHSAVAARQIAAVAQALRHAEHEGAAEATSAGVGVDHLLLAEALSRQGEAARAAAQAVRSSSRDHQHA